MNSEPIRRFLQKKAKFAFLLLSIVAILLLYAGPAVSQGPAAEGEERVFATHLITEARPDFPAEPSGTAGFLLGELTVPVPANFTRVVLSIDRASVVAPQANDEIQVTVRPLGADGSFLRTETATINANDASGNPIGEQSVISNLIRFEPGLTHVLALRLLNRFGTTISTSPLHLVVFARQEAPSPVPTAGAEGEATITPSPIGPLTLRRGDAQTVEVTVSTRPEAPIVPEINVFFLMDTTGSMGGEILHVTRAFANIVDRLERLVPRVLFGVGEFRDFPVRPFGRPEDRPFNLVQPITDDNESVLRALERLTARGGADLPESTIEALYQAATNPSVGFREGALPTIVLATDAPFRDPDDGDPAPVGARGQGETVAELNARRIKVIGIESEPPARPELLEMARDTGAVDSAGNPLVFSISATGTGIAEAIVAGIETVVREITISLSPQGDTNGFVTEISPREVPGVTAGESATFFVTFTGVVAPIPEVAQTFNFTINALGEGSAIVGSTDVTINVPAGPPVLAITPREARAVVGRTVDFRASGGVPPYTFVASAGSIEPISDTGATFTAPGAPGSVEVTLSDAEGATATAAVQVLPRLILSPPSAELDVGESTQFTASGGTGEYTFTASSGSFDTTAGPTVTYTAPDVPGAYALEVTDSAGNQAGAAVTVLVPRVVVIDSLNPSAANAGQSVQIAGSGFGATPEENAVNFGAEARATVVTASATSLTVIVPDIEPGVVDLFVTVEGVVSNSLPFEVTRRINQAPEAQLEAIPASGNAPLTVSFRGGGRDTDGEVVAFAWDFGDGTTSSEQITSHTYSRVGTFNAGLTVTDNEGATGSASVQIVVSAAPVPNRPPAAQVSASPGEGIAPLTVRFSSFGSSDSDGEIVSFAWDFGDGGASDEENPSHNYTSAGRFTARLTVADDDGATASDVVEINIVGEGTLGRLRPQVLAAGFDPTLVDITDDHFDIVALVRPGAVAIRSVTITQNLGIFSFAMAPSFTLPNGDILYRATFNFLRGSFGTQIFRALWGDQPEEFNITAIDRSQQRHGFPDLEFGNNPALIIVAEGGPESRPELAAQRVFRIRPQVLAAGFDTTLIDFNDDGFDIIAIVRQGAVPIRAVTLTQNIGAFTFSMNFAGTLPNGDALYRATFNFRRGQFGTTRFRALWGDRPEEFNVTVIDQAQQRHGFPNLEFGNNPAIAAPRGR